jgi:DNA repair exonuclease SbcCD ATPase subunit
LINNLLTKDFKKNLDWLDWLIERYRKISIELQVLKEEERKYWKLYSVFSKELPYFIFEQFLPVLMNLINWYLSICSDLELIHEISSKDGEKIEMNVFIKDHLGKRDVKSLSWWQKTLLKLVWILAVSKYSSTDFLFLDETINNIDHETIWRVAQMLESYVRENWISLYVVTHSQQIQSMDIRDKTLTPQK